MKRILSLTGAVLLTACTTAPNPVQSGDTLRVAASFYPLAYIAEQVGGDAVEVLQVTPGGVEPHEFEPSAQQIAAISKSSVFLMNGMGLDPWAERLAQPFRDTGITVMDASEGILLLTRQEEPHEGEEQHEDEENTHSSDPHVWLDPVRMQQIVDRVAVTFSTVNPVHAEQYRQRALALKAMLAALDSDYKKQLATCEIKEIITSHNAFSYIANRYGFTVHSISGLSPDEDPSPKRIAELATLAKAKDIRVVFFETLANPKLSETIAAEAGAATAVLNPIEGRTESEIAAGKGYDALMRDNLLALRAAMRCQ